MTKARFFLMGILFSAHCACAVQPTCDNVESIPTMVIEGSDNDFLTQLFQMSQEDKLSDDHDKVDALVYALATEKNEESHNSVLYTYFAPYYLSGLLLYTRLKEYVKRCIALLLFSQKEG